MIDLKTQSDYAEQNSVEGSDNNVRNTLCGIVRHSTLWRGPVALVSHRPQNRYPTASDAEIARRPGIHPSRVGGTIPPQPIEYNEYAEQTDGGERHLNIGGN
jgi:hypothetical protein